MSHTLLVKEPAKFKKDVFYAGILQRSGLSVPEISKVLMVDTNTITDSRLFKESIIELSDVTNIKDYRRATISSGGQKILADDDWKPIYFEKNGAQVLWSISQGYNEIKTGKPILKYLTKSNLNLETGAGISTISYEGAITGKEAFLISDHSLFTDVDPYLVVEKRA